MTRRRRPWRQPELRSQLLTGTRISNASTSSSATPGCPAGDPAGGPVPPGRFSPPGNLAGLLALLEGAGLAQVLEPPASRAPGELRVPAGDRRVADDNAVVR